MREKAKKWLEFAGMDIKRAERGAEFDDWEDALDHLQQAVEKSLKALLVLKNSEIPRTHRIDVLLKVLKDLGFKIEQDILSAQILTQYIFTTRYPDDYVPVSKEEYEEAYEIALKVYKWAKGIIEGSALE